MKPAERIEEGGRRALAYNQATQMVLHGFGDKDIHLIGVILAASGHYALDVLGPVPGVDVMAKRPHSGATRCGDSFRADGGAAFLRSWHLAPCASPWQSAL
jgi:hypothetical protein